MNRYLTSTALLTTLATPLFAHADIGRSDQSMRLLYEDTGPGGAYLEFSVAAVQPEANTETLTLDDPLEDYTTFSFGYLGDLSDVVNGLSVAVIYDQPYGAETRYQDGAPFFGGRADIGSDALTAVLKYQVDPQVSVHGGLRILQSSGEIYTSNSNLGANLFGLLEAESDPGVGLLIGAAFEVPEIALRVSATYSSAIELEFSGTERAFNPLTGLPVAPASNSEFDVEFPDSLNIEFQSGVAEGTLVFGSIRYVAYDGFNLENETNEYVNFTDDSVALNLGIGYQFTPVLAGSVSYSRSEPGGTPSSTALAPTTGRDALNFGVRYTEDQFVVSGGLTYGVLGDQTVENQLVPGGVQFEDSEVIGLGVRVGYRL